MDLQSIWLQAVTSANAWLANNFRTYSPQTAVANPVPTGHFRAPARSPWWSRSRDRVLPVESCVPAPPMPIHCEDQAVRPRSEDPIKARRGPCDAVVVRFNPGAASKL